MHKNHKGHTAKWHPKSFLKSTDNRKQKPNFKNDDSGVAAVEFAFIAGPFFLIIFSVMEIAMVFFGNTNIEYATREAARLIRTGQAQTGDFPNRPVDGDDTNDTDPITATQFKELVCKNMFLTHDCNSKIHVQVKTFDSWADIEPDDISLPITAGNYDNALHTEFETPESCKVTIVRAFIERTLIAQIPGAGVSNLSNGNLLQVGSAIFQTEPYQTSCP